ncbi:hybrid-cluster NAD(P)-dependent oxidoreductase [Shewanella algae]|uniref:hybrid-cluster NAD(P)-dependent oxidoreductase n=1 Tax=Shewanella algae TaxID=38313 RepID=UPI0009F6871A|nr:hybrid-cluster NAD(P)-dependent oxidoreductase [Shewanella algae]
MTLNPLQVSPAISQYQAGQWVPGELRLICVARWQETPDVVSFRFKAAQPLSFHFKPGQFVALQLEIAGEEYRRCYTISSSPSRPNSLMLTIKRVEGGKISNYLIDNLKPGHSLMASGPYGQFNLIDIPAERYLFLSAGCGITPMFSMSRFLTDSYLDSDIAFIHCARSEQDLIFRGSLRAMNSRHDNFKLGYLLEQGSETASVSGDLAECPMLPGRLSLAALEQLVPDYRQRTVYVCGPEAYMTATEQMLAQADFDMTRFHKESFAENTSAPAGDGSANYRLSVAGLELSINGEQTLLEALESEGLPIIAACRSGVCGSCKCRVVSGEVESSSQQTLNQDEIDSGMVLACSSRVKSDIQLETGPF